MSTSTKFLKCIAAQQSAFGTAASSGYFRLPFVGEYEDLQEEHAAEWDQGTWTPTTIVEKVAEYARITLRGAMFFELLPVIHNMAWDDVDATASDPAAYFIYDGEVDPTAVGAPIPYTFWLGGNEAIGGTGPMVRIQDAYVESYTLSGNLNTKEIAVTVTLFGLKVDDNSGAGFAAPSASLPTSLGMMKTLLGAFSIQDAAATGGDFATMTAIVGKMLDWSLTCNTGLMPIWSSDDNQLTYSGVRHNEPSIEFAPQVRTDSTTYAYTKGKANSKTYQELQMVITGADQRALTYNLTGRFLPNFIAHGRQGDEVVMLPTFRAETPHTQTTTPHWFSWELDTEWEHS